MSASGSSSAVVGIDPRGHEQPDLVVMTERFWLEPHGFKLEAVCHTPA